VFFYWAPAEIRERFAMLVRDGYKGSGDYGVFAFGAYNGQTANRSEGNRNLHVITRITYPFVIGNQIIEPGLQAYTGKWAFTSELSTGVTTPNRLQTTDQRIGATFVLYPKPFGIQAEYNVGTGPEFNKATDAIENKRLSGGYITASYKIDFKKQIMIPFVRVQQYEGGKKHELDARSYRVNETEIGVEWQPNKNFELVAMYTMSTRRAEDFRQQENLQSGSMVRLQAQVNF
jgi:hypothetical protein